MGSFVKLLVLFYVIGSVLICLNCSKAQSQGIDVIGYSRLQHVEVNEKNDKKSKVILKFDQPTEFHVVEVKGAMYNVWYKVKFNDMIGWVDSEYIILDVPVDDNTRKLNEEFEANSTKYHDDNKLYSLVGTYVNDKPEEGDAPQCLSVSLGSFTLTTGNYSLSCEFSGKYYVENKTMHLKFDENPNTDILNKMIFKHNHFTLTIRDDGSLVFNNNFRYTDKYSKMHFAAYGPNAGVVFSKR